MVFQSFNLFPHLTVLENVLVGPVRALKRKRAEVVDEALALLERIGLRDRSDEYPERLSEVNNNASPSCVPWPCEPAMMLLDEVTSASTLHWSARSSTYCATSRARAPRC